MPLHMTDHIQAVVIGGNVYVGGGYASFGRGNTVMVYSLQTGSWRTLLPYETDDYGMAAVNNQLVLVSASHSNVGVWDEGTQTWTHPCLKMPTSRKLTSVISYHKWLIVTGGCYNNYYSDKVELLDTLSGQWYEGPPLPNRFSEMSSAINGNMWYLSRGFIRVSIPQANKHVFSVCLDELISQAVSQRAGDATSRSTPSPWQTLTDTPLPHSTVLVVNRALLAVGGSDSSAIHHYQPSSKRWVKVGALPTKRWMCACTVLPSGEIFVAGGGGENDQLRVDIGTISF